MLYSDKTTPCRASFDNPSPAANSSSDMPLFLARANAPLPDKGQCVVHILGHEINTASFAMYTFSLSVLVQALLIISMSGAADHGNYRKKLLLSFAFTGALATMLFLPITPKLYLFGAFLAIISNTCFGASFVLLNSFLPLLVRHHPANQKAKTEFSPQPDSYIRDQEEQSHESTEGMQESDIMDSSTSLLSRTSEVTVPTNMASTTSSELQLSTHISSYGIGIGYIAAVLVQTFAIFIVILLGSSTFSLRLVLFIVGLWWLVFTIPAALWLRPRPGPPIPFSNSGKQRRSWLGYVAYAWRSLGKTILRARHLKDVIVFLGAWFLLSDGIATVSGTAVLFAKTELNMKPAALALINVIATLSGVLGAFSWSRFSRWANLRPSQTIIACICLFEVIPVYGLLGYIPQVKRLGFFGLQQPWEMYPLGAIYGLVIGGLSSYCRSLFGELIPPGSEAAFYALYAITDKGSSVFGPAIVGAITDRYGQIRPAFVFLAVLIAIPLPLMALVDVDRGKKEGAEMAKALEGQKDTRTEDSTGEGGITLIDEEAEN